MIRTRRKNPPAFLRVSQAAEFLGVSPWTLRNWDKAGKLKPMRHPKSGYRIYRHEDLEAILSGRGASTNGNGKLVPQVDLRDVEESEHFVQFYESDAFLAKSVAQYVGASLATGEAAVVIATEEHRAAIDRELGAAGIDVAKASARGRYVSLDAAETLSKFMIDGAPDAQRFADVIGSLIGRLKQGGTRVRAFGEMVALLWTGGNRAAAVRLEELWNDLAKVHTFALFCAYPLDGFGGDEEGGSFADVCTCHSRVVPAESYAALNDSNEQLRAIALLQKKAQALEAEIVHRKEVEKSLLKRERELADFFENATEGLHKVDPEGKIIWANNAELKLLGYEPHEYIGHHISEFHADRDVIDDMLARLTRGETLLNFPARLRRKDGAIRHVLINSNAYFEDGRFMYTRCFTRDVTQRRQAEEGLRRSEERLRAIVEATPECVKIVSCDGTLIYMNSAGVAMVECGSEDRVRGACVFDLVAPQYRDEWKQCHERVCGGESVNWEYEIIGFKGTRRWMETHAVPLPMPDGSTAHLAVTRDITSHKRSLTEREQLLEAEQLARAAAEHAGRLKDEFLATLSHELRTPLNAIYGWTQIIKGSSTNDETVAEGIAVIDRNVRAQTQLIEDLLDMSRIISGKVRLDVQQVEIVPVLKAALEAVRPSAEEKGIQLRQVMDSLAPQVCGDPNRLQQVAWNLLTNAVKFTPRGGTIELRVERVDDAKLEIVVSDSGQGIKPDFLPHIFERFRQADSSTTRQHGGLGLGLSIVKQLIDLHGGTIRADSAGEGRGATFTVTLPTAAGHDPACSAQFRGAGAVDCSGVKLDGVKVLVVDDEADARNLIARLLEDCDAEVILAASAEEAMELLKVHRPHVLVSDIGMPGRDGYRLIRDIRALASSELRTLPAVALTAFARAEDRTRAMLAGFHGHIAKPLEPHELIATVASLAGRAGN